MLELVVHYGLWELRRLKWWLGCFTLLCALAALASTANHWGDDVSLLPFAIVGVAFLATAELVVGDSPIETTAFNVGKPFDRLTLLGTKLLIAASAFLFVPLVAQWVLQRALGVSSIDAWSAVFIGYSRTCGWLSIAVALGAASRSMRGALTGFLIFMAVSGVLIFLLVFGFNFSFLLNPNVAWSVHSSADPGALNAIDQAAAFAPLLVAGWLFATRRAVVWSRVAIALLVFVRVIMLALTTYSKRELQPKPTHSALLAIDSVSTTTGNRLRIAYHVNGTTDSTGVVVNPAGALIEARSDTRIDTLYATTVVYPNDSTPAGVDVNASSRFDEHGRLLFREMFAKNGVLVVRRSDSLPIANATLHISATASAFRLGPVFTAPLALGTLFRDSTRRLELFSQPGANQRPILTLRLIDRNPASSPTTAAYRAEIADVGALELFEFSVEPNPMNCCNPIRRIRGSTESATYILPGSQRTRTEADFGVPYEVAARGGTTLSWREWRFERRERLEASAPIPRN